MLISYEKTTIYRIGSLRDTDAKFTSTRKVNWTNNPINVLGVYISQDMDECLRLNYEPIVTKVKNLLEVWRMRNLTLIGKIQVLNSLITSLFVYKMSVLPLIDYQLLSKLLKSFNEFLCDGKKPKIKLEILMAAKYDGGLGLANLGNRDKSLKAQWIPKLQQNRKLKIAL